MSRRQRVVSGLCSAFPAALMATALSAPSAPSSGVSVRIDGVPHIAQLPDFCGEACAAMALRHRGLAYAQEQVFDAAAVDPALGRGAVTAELARALGAIGFDVGAVWYKVPVARAAAELEGQWAALHADLLAGVPSIVCTRYDEQPATTEHFRLVLGYDAEQDEVIYHEPAEADGAYRTMPRARFLRLWPLKYDRARWTVVRMRLAPDDLRPPPARAGHTAADFAQHVLALRTRLPAGFNLVVQPPFVVIGDEPPRLLQRRAEGTVAWAVERLKRDYFADDPAQILDIWLFKDEVSYNHHALALFGARPHTPFGYYSEDDGALVMNIATGGGTLVHEIVHPFMAANFPGCPAWFNEGLGSLYEQSSDRDGHIRGLTNWRLGGLQEVIQAKTLPSFQALTRMDDTTFYADAVGDNYAQARYLLYYLQEQGLLVDYYRRFKRDRARDPTGYQTLKRVLGEKDMSAFQRRWERWVMQLSFPPST